MSRTTTHTSELVRRGLAKPMDDLDRKLRQSPEFRKAYEDLRPEFELIASLIEIRNKRGVTQRALAASAATSQSAIARIESGNYKGMSVATLEKLAEALGVRLVVRFEETVKPAKRGARVRARQPAAAAR